jgi:hypothetical protein
MATGFAHYQPEIEGADVNQQPFDDVFMPAEMRLPHRARLIQMGEAASTRSPRTRLRFS